MPQQQLAALFVLLVAATPVLIAAYFHLRRSRFTLIENALYLFSLLCARVLWRLDPPAALPSDLRSAVIVSNHRSSVDPFFLQVCLDRPIRWLVAREYCEHFLFGWFLRGCGVIPVSRGGNDIAAAKAAIRVLRREEWIGIFPEGRINMTDELLLPVRPGAVMIAVKARVPVIPCYIEGSPYDRYPWSPFFMRARVRVRFGAPISLTEPELDQGRGAAKQLMKEVVCRIAELAGQPEFEPRMAGRHWKPTASELAEAMSRRGGKG